MEAGLKPDADRLLVISFSTWMS